MRLLFLFFVLNPALIIRIIRRCNISIYYQYVSAILIRKEVGRCDNGVVFVECESIINFINIEF